MFVFSLSPLLVRYLAERCAWHGVQCVMARTFEMQQNPLPSCRSNRKRWTLAIALIIFGVMLATVWWVNQYVYATPFETVQLDTSEQRQLDEKLTVIQEGATASGNGGEDRVEETGPLRPEPYRERSGPREVHFTEREVNALLAQDPEMAKLVAIDFSEDLVSIRVLVPMDQDIPVLGGKTLRLHVGMRLGYQQGRPIVALTGISWGGIPIPSGWWGDIKNTNLVEEFAGQGGFWDQFAKGVKDIHVQEGRLRIQLSE